MEFELNALVESLRPILQRNGGDIQYAGYDETTETLSLLFRCANYHCPGANGAMQMLFEKKIRAEFPCIRAISFQNVASDF